jgi:hypothetical protein
MINLLPTKEKEVLLAELRKRMIIILCFLFLFFLVCLVLISFSIRIYLGGQIESQKTFLAESEKEFVESESQELQEKIKSANQRFKELSSFYKGKVYFFEISEKIAKTLPNTFYLTDFSLKLLQEKEVMVSLSGFAPLREDLFEFKKNLEQEENFKEVSFPPANWVKAKDINFHVTFKIYL